MTYLISEALIEGGYMVNNHVLSMKVKTYYAGDITLTVGEEVTIDGHMCTVTGFISDRELMDQGIFAMPEIVAVRREDGAELSYAFCSMAEGDHEVWAA